MAQGGTQRDAARLPPGERPPTDRRRSRLAAPQRRRAATLLGGDRQRRRRRAETGEKLGLLPLCRLEVAGLDVAEAADLLRQVREADRYGVVLRRERRDDLAEERLVVADEPALDLALMGVAEDVERRAAQALQFRQHREGLQHPGPEAHLARQARGLVAAGGEGRRPGGHLGQSFCPQ